MRKKAGDWREREHRAAVQFPRSFSACLSLQLRHLLPSERLEHSTAISELNYFCSLLSSPETKKAKLQTKAKTVMHGTGLEEI